MKKLKLFLLTTLSFLFILSCEIGLGASVDTDPPQLTINNPPVDSVIRNTFAISGEYSDDGTIDSVTATLQKIDDGSTFELTGNFTQNEIKRLSGTWSIEVNPKTSDGGVAISDGAYQATIFIKDTSGRITKQNTTFTIDNTPPVLILTKPSSKPGDETLSVYGQRLFLEGSIADTTKETYIEASFYADEACTQLLDTVKTDAIAPTDVNSNNAKIATFLDAHYDKIYGNSKNGNLKLYAKLKVYDSAISIPLNGVQTAEDKKGNSTSTYYVSKDLAKKISLSKTSGGYGLAPIDLYHILSGKEKNNDNGRSAADRANIINELNSIKTQKSYFSLNPDNSPYFTVSGLKTLTKSGHDFDDSENGYYLKNGTITLEVSVFMGNDSIELVDDEDFYVYLQRCDEIGNATINNQTIAPKIPLYSKYGERIEGDSKKYLYKVGGKEGHKTTTGAYVFSIPMNKILETNTDEGVVNLNLSYNETYLIGVNGCDNERNPVVAYDNGYGFKFVASGTGPIVIVENEMYVTTNTTNITEEAIKSPLKVTVSVDTTESELTIKRAPDNDPINPPAEEEAVYIKDENGLDITSITIPGSQTSINAYDYYQIPANAENGKEYKVKYFVKDNVNPESATKVITYRIDSSAPVINSIKLDDDELQDLYQTNALELNVNVSDVGSGVAKVEYKTDEISDWSILSPRGDEYKGIITFLNNGQKTLYIRAIDKVGNIYNSNPYNLTIDTDGPDFEVLFDSTQNGQNTETTAYINKDVEELYYYGKYSDKDSGVEKLNVTLNGQSAEVSYLTGTTWEETYSGLKNASVTENGNSISAYKEYESITDITQISFWRAKFTKQQLKKAFSEDPDNPVYPENSVITTLEVNGKNKTNKAISYIQKNKVCMDNKKPEFKNISLNSENDKGVYRKSHTTDSLECYVSSKVGKTFTLTGSIKEDTGINSVSYLDVTEDLEETPNPPTETLSFTVNPGTLDGGEKTFLLSVSDKAGNSSEFTLTVHLDNSAPEGEHKFDAKGKDIVFRIGSNKNIEVSSDDLADQNVGGKYSGRTYGNTETTKIRGKFNDLGSGPEIVYYKVFDSEPDGTEDFFSKDSDGLFDKLETEADGSFSILSEDKLIKKRVFYTKQYEDKEVSFYDSNNIEITLNEGGKYYLTDVESNYYTSISGLKAGENFLVLVPVDKVGNASVEKINVPEVGLKENYRLNVDTEGPDISSDVSTILYSNGTQEIEITGTVHDIPAGVDTIEIYTTIPKARNSSEKQKIVFFSTLSDNGAAHPESGENDLTEEIKNQRFKKWSANIDTSLLKYEATGGAPAEFYEGTVTIYASAADLAGEGNTSTVSAATIIMDRELPEVVLTLPADADNYSEGRQVNGLLTLSGTATDTKGLDEGNSTAESKKLTLLYSYSENGEYQELISGKNEASWKLDIDTKDLRPEDKKETDEPVSVWVKVASKDIAGNTGYSSPLNIVVDPHSDRPVISFSNISVKDDIADIIEKRAWVRNSQIRGTIEDDDGVIELCYSFTGNDNDWSENCFNSANKEFVINLPTDGSMDDKHRIYFKVKESGSNKEYISKNVSDSTTALSTPKLLAVNALEESEVIVLGNTTGKYDTTLYVNIDLIDPILPVLAYTVDDCSEYFVQSEGVYTKQNLGSDFILNNQPKDSIDIKWKNLSTSIVTGGPAENLYILVKAEDANGIDSIILKDGTNTIDGIYKREEKSENSSIVLYSIDISDIEYIDNKTISISAKDKAGKPKDVTFEKITIDRKAPVISITSPLPGETIYGNEGVADNRVTVSGRIDDKNDVSHVYLAITKSENEQPGDNAYFEITTENTVALMAVFNGDTENPNNFKDEYFGDLFNTWVNKLYGNGISYNEFRKDICLWFYAIDEFGNTGKVSPKVLPLTVLTQGDKPEVGISYPLEDTTHGGTITVTGSTTIATDTVDKIYIQIDPDYNGTEFASNWKEKMETIIAGRTKEEIGYEIVNTGLTGQNSEGKTYAIETQGSVQSWYLTMNMLNEFNKKDNEGRLVKSKVALRVFAIGKTNKKLSEVKELLFNLDPGAPVFGNKYKLRLVQFEQNDIGTGDEVASLLYKDDMWIQGKWWLTGSVEDDSGIETLVLTEEGNEENKTANLITEPNLSEALPKTENPEYNDYLIKIPVGNPEGTELCYGPKFKIKAKENRGSNFAEEAISLQCDNLAPNFYAESLSENSNNSIVQSEGVYSIDGKFDDGQGSGFKRIVLYVTREIAGTTYLTDYMSSQGTTSTGIPDNCYDINGFTGHETSTDLYWEKISGCEANNMEITLPSDKEIPDYVHDGCLCRINNVLYLIKTVYVDTKTITLDTAIDSGSVDVEFTVAQVIDNTVSETGRTTTFNDSNNRIANDDGDKMVESYTKSTKTWSVAINSQNIKDGVIKLHFVAFDEAGNSKSKEYNGTVSNNRPRIAGVKFGSDVDGSGEVTASEMKIMYAGLYNKSSKNKIENVTVNGQSPNGNKIYALAIPNDGDNISVLSGAPVLTVKGKVTILPEIVGGNDGLSWSYCVGEKNDANIVKNANGTRKLTEMVNTHSSDIREADTPINLEVSDILSVAPDDGNTDFHFQIWDHTEGTEIGDTSNRADLSLRFYIALNDGIPPEAKIRPFYWNDSSDNSIYYETSGTKKIARGHIELESDLPEEIFKDEYSGELDRNPKLSGIVYLEGTAKDNVVVEELLINFPGITSGFRSVAKRERQDSEKLGQWQPQTTLTNNGIYFESADEETVTDEDGLDYNVINWKLAIDTSKVTNVAALDCQIQVKAKDRGGAKSDGSFGENIKESSVDDTAQTSITSAPWSIAKTQPYQFYHDVKFKKPVSEKDNIDETDIVYRDSLTPTYKVDVVPYITTVTTALRGKLKSSIKEAYARTTLGHYIVRSDEVITIEGYNLGSSTVSPKYGTTDLNISNGVVTFPVSNLAKSGSLSLTVSGIETLNNINNNNACGSYKTATTSISEDSLYELKAAYAYNRMPNRTSNNLLTDDVVIDVWQFDSDAAIPESGELREPVMKINPRSGKVGVAFVSGPAHFAMSNGLPEHFEYCSYKSWQRNYATYSNVSFVYDDLGYSHGTATGLDTNPSSVHAGKFTYFYSKWGASGTGDQNGNYNGSNAIRLEGIGIPNKTYTDPTSGETVQLLVNGYIPTAHSLTETRFYSPSLATTVHGTETSVYLAYYDSIQKQIRFRCNSNLTGVANNKVANEDFQDNAGYGYNNDNGTYKESETQYFSIIAGVDYQQGTVITKDGKKCLSGYDTGYTAYKYVAIDAKKGATAANDVVVAVWYDGTNCRFAYTTDPTSGKDNGNAGGWIGNKVIFTDGGEHCTVKFDYEGGVHIAAYVDGSLKYAYLSSPSAISSYNENTDSVKIDSFTITGERITIDVGKEKIGETDNYAVVPYISYFNGTARLPSVAKLVIPESGEMNYKAQGTGTLDGEDIFTGNWEVTLVPSPKTLTTMYYDKINLCLWKDNTGKVVKSNYSDFEGTEKNKTSENNDSTTKKTEGHIYGNGTANPILGYAIESDTGTCLETAQMK